MPRVETAESKQREQELNQVQLEALASLRLRCVKGAESSSGDQLLAVAQALIAICEQEQKVTKQLVPDIPHRSHSGRG